MKKKNRKKSVNKSKNDQRAIIRWEFNNNVWLLLIFK